MTNQSVVPPSDSPAQIYELTGQARRAWYTFLVNGEALKCLLWIVSLPCGFALMCYFALSDHPTEMAIQMVNLVRPLSIVFAIGLAACWIWIAKQHLRRAMRITITTDGVTLETPRSKTDVSWSEIVDVFPSPANEFVLWTKKGDFYFSKEMQGADNLAAKIGEHVSEKSNYELSLCQEETYFQRMVLNFSLAFFMVLLTVLQIELRALYSPNIGQASKSMFTPAGGGILLFAAAFSLVITGLYAFGHKVPQCLRLGADGVLIKTSSRIRKFRWSQLEIDKSLFGPVLSTENEWFLILWQAFLGLATRKNKAQQQAVKDKFVELTAAKLASTKGK